MAGMKENVLRPGSSLEAESSVSLRIHITFLQFHFFLPVNASGIGDILKSLLIHYISSATHPKSEKCLSFCSR